MCVNLFIRQFLIYLATLYKIIYKLLIHGLFALYFALIYLFISRAIDFELIEL